MSTDQSDKKIFITGKLRNFIYGYVTSGFTFVNLGKETGTDIPII
jgi:hypothetical protein